ncbi:MULTISPECIES: BlaI/MecI/CopY family transcriptional regulator [Stenotrophomonas]|uniref:BlaI/MecI/CopY family transcriptional regulator n=1 Tax=Stenotrophomonas TaxID=40323 RepID=UPI000D53FC52|nr:MULTISPECIES: BlaI/MecI/CopY family transcriptional regulator [Stenotrophomonas]AWH30301.1 BlaI/MecI/CopY family transcriptional regulator [Stenotrophomonas sp. YAU14A_MKIMI4_1]AWH34251.1 BlaI/MecI/CopY family transcriptional regulator [Stenotrophomonas sp. SAU14A_NAIMI4_8]
MSAISEAEAIVMEVLWQQSPRSADDVVAALAHRNWAEPTIKTLLNRLLTKGAIAAERDGRRYLYLPLLQRQAWVDMQSQDFIGRVFDGRVAPLVAHFSERGQLTAQDIAELKKLIQEMDDE